MKLVIMLSISVSHSYFFFFSRKETNFSAVFFMIFVFPTRPQRIGCVVDTGGGVLAFLFKRSNVDDRNPNAIFVCLLF